MALLPSLVSADFRSALDALLRRPTAKDRIDHQFTPPFSPSRWTDGTFPAFYVAESAVTAFYEKLHHDALFLARFGIGPHPHTLELLTLDVAATLEDVRPLMIANPALASHDDYSAAQALAVSRAAAGADGLLYTSVRDPRGRCAVLFKGSLVSNPRVHKSVSVEWNGDSFLIPPGAP